MKLSKKEAELKHLNSFSYKIVRSKRKTLAIIIKSGEVEVKSPTYLSEVEILSFVEQKASWVERQLAEQRVRLAQKLVLEDGREVPFFGLPRRIEVILSAQQQVKLHDRRLLIYTRQNTPEQLEKLLHRWLLQQAREYMATQTIKLARQLGVEHKLKQVVFRKTRSKWGHCCADGTIQYNWLSMMAPKPVIDYLIAHESSHLLHMNHSTAFWRTVASICPDYRDLKDWLQNHGHRFWT